MGRIDYECGVYEGQDMWRSNTAFDRITPPRNLLAPLVLDELLDSRYSSGMNAADDNPSKVTRRTSQRVAVWLLPEEKVVLELNAKRCALSTSAFLRNLGLGYSPKGVADQVLAVQLYEQSANIRRFGGLLKMWLSNDERLDQFGREEMQSILRATLEQTNRVSAAMLEIIPKIAPLDD